MLRKGKLFEPVTHIQRHNFLRRQALIEAKHNRNQPLNDRRITVALKGDGVVRLGCMVIQTWL